jgi:hypothetical protein
MREKADSQALMPLFSPHLHQKLSIVQHCFGRVSKRLAHTQTFEYGGDW